MGAKGRASWVCLIIANPSVFAGVADAAWCSRPVLRSARRKGEGLQGVFKRRAHKKRGYTVCTSDYVVTNTRRSRLQRTQSGAHDDDGLLQGRARYHPLSE
jgi:hypothetical protein